MRLILLDFDGTIFNTEKLKKLLPEFVGMSLFISGAKFKETYETTKNSEGAYDLFYHLKFLGAGSSESEIEEKFTEFFQKEEMVFNDFKELKNSLGPDDYLCVYTLGFDRFQNLKLSLDEATKDIRKIILETNKKNFFENNLKFINSSFKFADIENEFDSVYFVDDNPKHFTSELFKNLKQFRILRDDSKYKDIPTPKGVTEIKLLTEINEN